MKNSQLLITATKTTIEDPSYPTMLKSNRAVS